MAIPRYFQLVLICLLPGFFLTCKQPTPSEHKIAGQDCAGVRDTTFTIQVQNDTTTGDFYQMVAFLINKGELEYSLQKDRTALDTFVESSFFFKKILCEKKNFETLATYWLFENVFIIGCELKTKQPLGQSKDLYPQFYLRQLNFLTEAEMETAYSKIKEIGWGDPEKKWNDYYIAGGKKRIYILTTGFAASEPIKNKYGSIIQKEWADKR